MNTLSSRKHALSIGMLALMLLFAATMAHAWLMQSQEADVAAVAVGRKLIADGLARPLDLTTNYTTPVTRFTNITRFPAWRTVPVGFQTFAHVPFQIEGMICLWGQNSETKHNLIFPKERLGIQVNEAFDALYVYHCCFFTEVEDTPVCDVVFRYKDGTSATNQMRYGSDFLDWITAKEPRTNGPTSLNSSLAWYGGSSSTNEVRPLQICLTALANPRLGKEVSTIDLYSCKSHTTACIMAMTTGKAGLMQRRTNDSPVVAVPESRR